MPGATMAMFSDPNFTVQQDKLAFWFAWAQFLKFQIQP